MCRVSCAFCKASLAFQLSCRSEKQSRDHEKLVFSPEPASCLSLRWTTWQTPRYSVRHAFSGSPRLAHPCTQPACTRAARTNRAPAAADYQHRLCGVRGQRRGGGEGLLRNRAWLYGAAAYGAGSCSGIPGECEPVDRDCERARSHRGAQRPAACRGPAYRQHCGDADLSEGEGRHTDRCSARRPACRTRS